MPQLREAPPHSRVQEVTEILHGVTITDPYRWLEDQSSLETRCWLDAQSQYAGSYLDGIPGRERIRARVRELLDIETYDSIQQVGSRYLFRKRVCGREQACLFLREGSEGEDQLLIDPAERGTGPYTALKPLCASADGRLLLYELKVGGERTATFELLDIATRTPLPEILPRGFLRGFAFAPDGRSFYYVHEPAEEPKQQLHAAYHHVLGESLSNDREVFFAGEGRFLRLHIVAGREQLGFLVYRFGERTSADFYLWRFGSNRPPQRLIENAEYKFGPRLIEGKRVLAITDCNAPNLRIVEVHPRWGGVPKFVDLIPSSDVPIRSWLVAGDKIFVSYLRKLKTEIHIFDLSGHHVAELPSEEGETVRLTSGSETGGDLFYERESFSQPLEICRYSVASGQTKSWAARQVPLNSEEIATTQLWFPAADGTPIPMYLVGRPEILASGSHPTVMTAYGGYGVSMTPQFSVLVAFLLEQGCLFALPNIRGGSELGVEWHHAARRRSKPVAWSDFLAAAEWLIASGRSEAGKLAIFGGSHSGLLVGAAITARPELFRAALCMVPLLDMLRYHLFDRAHVWQEEFGTADNAEDFAALLAYSPYHRVRSGVAYPATMIVSGDCDQNCNPLHARKMTARLQAANISEHPILIDYSRYRGHSPVLPLSARVEALTDRLAFFCQELGLTA